MEDQDARDINQMMSMSGQPEVSIAPSPKKSRLLWIVVGCVVVGIGLGVVVYQQSVKPLPVTSTPRPTATAVTTIPSPVGSPQAPTVNVIDKTMESNVITFPAVGKVRIYFKQLKGGVVVPSIPTMITLTNLSGTVTVRTPTSVAGSDPMATITTTMNVTAGQAVTIKVYSQNDTKQPAIGWVKPLNDTCGRNGFDLIDISAALGWAKSGSSPIVSTMCWSEANPNPDKDRSAWAFNHYFIVLAYDPPAGASASPTATPTPSLSPSPSPSPTNYYASPSPSPSRSPSPSPTNYYASVTPTPSARAAMPDTSGGTPVTGVFEVTVGTVSVGLILLMLGLFGLLAL
jgi:hypothetical protein